MFRYILVSVLIIPALSQTGNAQQFSKLLVKGYGSQPEDVLVAISPSGEMFRADGIKQGSVGNTDTLRIFSFDESMNEIAVADIVGFVDNAALEADDDRIYLNLKLNSLENQPVYLPGIGLISTGDYSQGSILVAMNHDLVVEWYEFFGADSYGSGFWECDILFMNNGNLLFNVWEDHPDYFLYVKLKEYTPDGNLVSEFWQTELVYTMQEDSQGNLYVTGPCASQEAVFNGEEVTLSFTYNFYVVKYDISRNYVWSNYVEDGTCPYTDLVLNSYDELFLLTPSVSGEFIFDDIVLNIPSNNHFVVAKLDDQGAFEWAKTITENETGGFGATSITFNSYAKAADSGNIFFCGIAYGNLVWNHGLQFDYLPNSPFIARLGNDGIVDWVKFGETTTSSFPSATHVDIVDQGLVIGGMGQDSIRFDSVQVFQDGPLSYLALMPFENLPTGKSDFQAQRFTVFPNPATNQLQIHAGQNLREDSEIKLVDLTGKVQIHKTEVSDFPAEINTENLKNGMYIISVYSGMEYYSQKLIIQR